MNTRILMTTSAAVMGAIGLALSFLPGEFLGHIEVESNALLNLVLQTLGAVYLGFASLNSSARNNLIGGIYSRPLAVGNLIHFAIVALTLTKLTLTTDLVQSGAMWVTTIVYVALAASFTWVVFARPKFNTT